MLYLVRRVHLMDGLTFVSLGLEILIEINSENVKIYLRVHIIFSEDRKIQCISIDNYIQANVF